MTLGSEGYPCHPEHALDMGDVEVNHRLVLLRSCPSCGKPWRVEVTPTTTTWTERPNL